jgi:copper chaperone CopZ
MFSFLQKKPAGESVVFAISGMHCTSCSLSIDGELEDTIGVIRATTNYAKAKTIVEYDPSKVSVDALKKVIESLEYSAVIAP